MDYVDVGKNAVRELRSLLNSGNIVKSSRPTRQMLARLPLGEYAMISALAVRAKISRNAVVQLVTEAGLGSIFEEFDQAETDSVLLLASEILASDHPELLGVIDALPAAASSQGE